jgi:hypothetical protein
MLEILTYAHVEMPGAAWVRVTCGGEAVPNVVEAHAIEGWVVQSAGPGKQRYKVHMAIRLEFMDGAPHGAAELFLRELYGPNMANRC